MISLPLVLIVGRPNVGKSTLFNRLIGKSIALVDDRPGSTRDLREGTVTWNGRSFQVLDSGGWVPGENDPIAGQIARNLDEKARHASILLWLSDAKDGVTAADEILGRHLRRFGVPIVLAANKSDRYERFEQYAADFARLGVDPTVPISASHGIGIDDLLDHLLPLLPNRVEGNDPSAPADPDPSAPLRVTLLGKPNVGKSTLANSLLGEKRLLVDGTPGTTHDAVEIPFEREGHRWILVDTAGLRSPKKLDSRIEHLSVHQTLQALQTCQVALFLVDGEKGITQQDVAIGRTIEESFRPVVILINKWDAHPKGMEQSWAEKITKRHLKSLYHAPVIFISSLSGYNLPAILPEARSVYEESLSKIPTGKLNDVLHQAVSKQPPTAKKGHFLKVLYGYQRKGHPPAVEIIANHPESTRTSYVRYLEDEIRNAFDMKRTPLQVVMKLKKQAHKKNPKKRIVRR